MAGPVARVRTVCDPVERGEWCRATVSRAREENTRTMESGHLGRGGGEAWVSEAAVMEAPGAR